MMVFLIAYSVLLSSQSDWLLKNIHQQIRFVLFKDTSHPTANLNAPSEREGKKYLKTGLHFDEVILTYEE